ncbi:MAG: alpha/beta hydrolase [Candidatus Binatus sp.]|uniref:alpha/beta fold hydrolase n=1 Tax=Candidatus Binatus sp. TaxID=2811406 RepID=UPI0027195305|nr:alpha/beta hydrolase [Candidatus Binatus sp.]MDO8433795.1 alpha/beta hydrolase [Candidatus Binatus sp.]
MSAAISQSINLPGGFVPNPVLIDGKGSPVVYLHGPFGQEWDGFLDDLATRRRVYAPAHAGAEDIDDLQYMDNFSDLVLYYDDLFDQLGLERVDLVGHSFGGMVAAEYAATFPHRVGKLVLIDALGLWRDDIPVEDHLLASPEKQVALLFNDPAKPEVKAKLAMPENSDELREAILRRFGALASTSHFIHPIPERGLARRLRRIKAPTLIIWGAQDKLTPPVYAEEFASRIGNSRVQLIENAGHMPQVEQREMVTRHVIDFLK